MSQINSPSFLRGLAERAAKSKDESLLWAQTIRILEQLYNRTGGTVDAVEQENEFSSLHARVAQLEYELEDNPFTIDSTGWTVDTTRITVDMAKA